MPDLINSLFEVFGGTVIASSAVKLYNQKKVRGVSWIHACVFWLWGLWNLYYYPSLDQTFSFAAGMYLFLANTVWMFQLFYYRKR